MNLLLLNIIISFIWMGLMSMPTSLHFTVGFIIGYLLIASYNYLFKGGYYLKRSIGLILFVFYFIKAFILSNITIALSILCRKRKDIYPNIIEVDVDSLEPFEILLLTHCITLTPGTTSVAISDNYKSIFVHAFDGKDPKSVRDSILNELQKPLLRMTR